MLDRWALVCLRKPVEAGARWAVRAGASANGVTLLGFGLGLLAMLCIANAAYGWGLLGIVVSRCCDALDGAIARKTRATDAGGFLDISLDFVFYAGVVLAFAVADPAANALAAAALLTGFMGTASSFLAFAALAAKRGWVSAVYPHKSIYFLGGLTEATETLALFAVACIWPQHFAVLAYGFALLCGVTTLGRIWGGWRALSAVQSPASGD